MVIFKRNCFVTCRNEKDSFYLCRILENIRDYDHSVRIRWCELTDQTIDQIDIDEKTRFLFGHYDRISPHSILLEIEDIVRHDDQSVSLTKDHIRRTKQLLNKSIGRSRTNEKRDSDSQESNGSSTEAATPKKKRRQKRLTVAKSTLWRLMFQLKFRIFSDKKHRGNDETHKTSINCWQINQTRIVNANNRQLKQVRFTFTSIDSSSSQLVFS